jgi:hypothetical protein
MGRQGIVTSDYKIPYLSLQRRRLLFKLDAAIHVQKSGAATSVSESAVIQASYDQAILLLASGRYRPHRRCSRSKHSPDLT